MCVIYISKKGIATLKNQPTEELEEYYISNGFKKHVLEDKYIDCEYQDFDEDLTFSVAKYNTRKQRESDASRIIELKKKLADTDYQALKYAEGAISAVDYLPMKKQRQEWRDEINDLEAIL